LPEHFAPPKTTDPVGTLDELEAVGLDGGRYHSCSVPSEHSAGCRYLDRKTKTQCVFGYKAKPSAEGGGPHNHAIYQRNIDGSFNTFAAPCFHFMALMKQNRDSGVIYEVVGNEGDPFEEKGTIEQVELKADGGKRIKVPDVLFKKRVPKFLRPMENPLLAEEIHGNRLVAIVGSEENMRRVARQTGAAAGSIEGMPLAHAMAFSRGGSSLPVVDQTGDEVKPAPTPAVATSTPQPAPQPQPIKVPPR
jgi:hypothetical protein